MSASTELAPLTKEERDQLIAAEEIIANGLQTFYDVGKALLIVKYNRLYRATHAKFSDYVRDRWDMQPRYSEYVLAATEVVDVLKANNCSVLPSTESQARPLTTIEMEQVGDVWAEVIDKAPLVNGQHRITAALVQEIVDHWREADKPYQEPAEEPKEDPEDVPDAEEYLKEDKTWARVRGLVMQWAQRTDGGHRKAIAILRALSEQLEEQ